MTIKTSPITFEEDYRRAFVRIAKLAAGKAFSATAYAYTGDIRLMDVQQLRASVIAAVLGEEVGT